jgi:pimeloyl-ACP methyl ester carboxylesterase
MFLNDDGIRLHIELELPENGEAKHPLAVIFHGFTGHMEEPHILAVCRALREAGCATLRAELYGHGRSGGAFRDHTLYRWVGNALTVIDYARTLDFVTGLYVGGHSQGGLTAMLAAGLEHDRISGAILLSPAWTIPEMARKGLMLGRPFDPAHIPDSIPLGPGADLDGNYLRVAQTIYVEDAIDRFTGPVLLVHGTADETIPWQHTERAARRYRDASVVLVEDDTHCYDRHLDRVTRAVYDWIKEKTAP